MFECPVCGGTEAIRGAMYEMCAECGWSKIGTVGAVMAMTKKIERLEKASDALIDFDAKVSTLLESVEDELYDFALTHPVEALRLLVEAYKFQLVKLDGYKVLKAHHSDHHFQDEQRQ